MVTQWGGHTPQQRSHPVIALQHYWGIPLLSLSSQCQVEPGEGLAGESYKVLYKILATCSVFHLKT